MKKWRLLWRVIKTTYTDKILLGFLGFVLFSALIFTLTEPSIKSFGDGMWYAFAVFTTIGFGDLVAVTLVGRVVTIILAIYGIFVVALIPGIIVNYYTEFMKAKRGKSIAQFLDKLEQLPELPREELAKISEYVKEGRYKL